jgi:nucleoside-diphosphate kinase
LQNDNTDFFCFSCEYETPEVTRKLNLYFYARDNSLELYDVCLKRPFLKRCVTEITLSDIYIGAKLLIFNKPIIVKGYGNFQTSNRMSKIKQRAFLMIKPEARSFIGEIISTLERNNFLIKNLKMLKMQALSAVQFLNQRNCEDANISSEMENLTSGPIVVMEIIGENVNEQLKLLSCDATALNRIMISEDVAMNQQDLEFFFTRMNDQLKVQAKFTRSTLCIIRPHAVKENLIGGILKMITENGFSITAMKMLQLSRSQCELFCEVYKGVVDNFVSMITQLHSGICLALEVQGDDDVQTKFRALCGPADVSIAKQIRPRTIRAVFGTDKTLNAVHCTDLFEDTLLELEYIFKDIQN